MTRTMLRRYVEEAGLSVCGGSVLVYFVQIAFWPEHHTNKTWKHGNHINICICMYTSQ